MDGAVYTEVTNKEMNNNASRQAGSERIGSITNRKAVALTPQQLRKLQLAELEILIEFDRVCRKNGLKYCLACGTLLGAVRHKGFIPWDDDIDVWMMREEYEKFCRICERELDEKYFFQNWDTDPCFNSAYGKLRKKGTRYIRAGQERMKYKDGIYIDILPLDNMPDHYWERWKMAVGAWVFRKLTYAQAGSMCEENPVRRMLFRLLAIVPLSFSKKTFEALITKYKTRETLFCKCLGDIHFTPYWKEDFLELIEWEFEGHRFFIPKRYDAILKNDIGIDYMQLPPKEMRRPHANASYIDFGK